MNHKTDYLVVDYSHPNDFIQTSYGRITVKHWMMLEVLRWKETNFREAWLDEDKEGLVALCSHRAYMKVVTEEDV